MELIEGKQILWHVIERSKMINASLVLATTDRAMDNILEKIATDCGILCFRGSTNDLLDRYYKAAKWCNADIILRITADDPLIDPNYAKPVMELLKSGKYDYVGYDETAPIGVGVEGYTIKALEKAWLETKNPFDREHVSPYIKNTSNNFKIHLINSKQNLSKYRLTVDYPEDLELIRKIYSELYHGKIFYTDEIIKLLEKRTEFLEINKKYNS